MGALLLLVRPDRMATGATSIGWFEVKCLFSRTVDARNRTNSMACRVIMTRAEVEGNRQYLYGHLRYVPTAEIIL